MRILGAIGLAGAVLLGGCASTAASQADRRLGLMLAGQSAVQGTQLDAALAQAGEHHLGSRENPVRASMPAGERAYLARLRCADGLAPEYVRQGSLGIGPFGNIVDGYSVTCAGKEMKTVVMDMYHSNFVEDRAVPGFTIARR